MKVDLQTVEKIADLAKLEFSKSEKEEILKDMNNILTFVEKLNELDTDKVEPLIYITDEVNVLRDDKVGKNITKEEGLKNAPIHDSDYIKVQKFIRQPGKK
ncbi:MAG: Asp-tRNA(Asn)/Glu-tRNA(Gln) amidotransferase subunit GatC [Bacteroidetes bacterium]|nr:Asp-tRNA(Asn)/Glu-tRNA(Gln) amidotransferase subunit GatC [Bacteroidota bacterium]